jgi:hypothetical protein
MTGRERRPTGPPITIPSAEFLGRIAYHTWFEADLPRPAVDWMELSEAERDTWRQVAQRVAERIRVATERVTHSATTCRRPGVQQSGRIATPSTSAAAGTRTRPTTAPTTKATVGCRSSRELAPAALATILQDSTAS